MILTSSPAVICPMATDAATSSTANAADAVEHAVAHALLEHVPGDQPDAPHAHHAVTPGSDAGSPTICEAQRRRALRMKTSSSVVRMGVTDTSVAPFAASSAMSGSGRYRLVSSLAYRASAILVTRAATRDSRSASRSLHAGQHDLPATAARRRSDPQACRTPPAVPRARMPTPLQSSFGVREHVRDEQHRPPFVTQFAG